MVDKAPQTAGKWGDLLPRVVSAVLMVAVGALALWLGGLAFAALGVVIAGLMTWELARMIRPDPKPAALVDGGLAALALAVALSMPGWAAAVVLCLLVGVLVLRSGRHPLITGAYGAGIFLGAYGLVQLRLDAGLGAALWLIAIVIATDIAGYFAGRIIGGPKFWPRVSPKKTWSGTVAGWVAAALLTVIWGAFLPILGDGGTAAQEGLALWVAGAVALSFASQMGDAAESAIKRKMGVKDSSNLIPGHGGVMDRFDAMIGASVALTVFGVLAALA